MQSNLVIIMIKRLTIFESRQYQMMITLLVYFRQSSRALTITMILSMIFVWSIGLKEEDITLWINQMCILIELFLVRLFSILSNTNGLRKFDLTLFELLKSGLKMFSLKIFCEIDCLYLEASEPKWVNPNDT